jgi:hypothetical protein
MGRGTINQDLRCQKESLAINHLGGRTIQMKNETISK